MKASSFNWAGNVDSGFVNGVIPVGNGGEAGCSIRSLTAEGGETYAEVEADGCGWWSSRDGIMPCGIESKCV
jgi:hypothetical protein